MFKVPTNQDILEFIAQHVDVELIAKKLDADGCGGDEIAKTEELCKQIKMLRPQGRNRFFVELSDIDKLRGRVDLLVPAIASQIARLSSDDIKTQKQCAKHVFKQFRLLECVYNSIRQSPLYTLTEQSAGNLAMVELFLLPYLKRLSHELNQTYPNNFLFHYLKRYVDVIFVSLDNPMATFISEHKREFREISGDANYLSDYRKDRYKKLSIATVGYTGKGLNLKRFLGWHIAGSLIYSIIKMCTDKNNGTWCDDDTLLAAKVYEGDYDVVYNNLLSLNAREAVVNAVVSNYCVEVQSIIKLFRAHVGGYELIDDFISESTVKKTYRTLYKTLKEKQSFLYDFCLRVDNGEVQLPAEVGRAQNALDALYKFCHIGSDAFSFAHYIFIAKYKNGQAKKHEALHFCTQVMFESGVDPFTAIKLNFTKKNIDDIDMTYAEHMRCRYVGYFNWLLGMNMTFDFINPIIEVDRFLLSVIKPVGDQGDAKKRVYELVGKDIIEKNAKQVKNPCVGVMKFGVKIVVANLAFFKYVFQLCYPWPEEDNEAPGNGMCRYDLLTKQQQGALLEFIPDEASRINDVDIDLIPVL